MARLYSVQITSMALSAATAKVAFELSTPATLDGVKVVEWSLTFDGTSASAVPVAVDWIQTTGSSTGGAYVPLKIGTTVAAATYARTAATVGAGVTSYFPYNVPPTSGIVVQAPLGREPITLLASQFWALRVIAPATVNANGYVIFEE